MTVTRTRLPRCPSAPRRDQRTWVQDPVRIERAFQSAHHIDARAYLIAQEWRLRTPHAVVMRGLNSAMISEIAQNLTWNLDGIFETINVSTAMGDYMKRIAARIAADHQAMTNRYEVEFQSGTSELDVPIRVQVRPGLTVQMSLRRPF